MSNPRHPLLGVNPSPRPTQDTKPKRHPTFFVSSASPSPALAPSTDDSPEIIPSAAPTQPNPHRAPGTKHITTTQSMSERLRRRSEGYGSYDPPGTDPTYSVPLNDIAQTSGIAYSAPTTNTIEPQRPDPSSVEISTQSLPAPTYSQSAQTSPTRSRRTSTSYMFGPRRPSRASLAALRSALQEYQVPSPHTPERRAFTEERMGLAGRSMSTLDLKSAASAGLGLERMHALVEIHRVLYRGREGGAEGWEKQVGEVRRVVERWFEADCAYDHPLVQLTSRHTFLAHFILLHLASSLSIPSLTPSSLISHARGMTWYLRSTVFGTDDEEHDIEAMKMLVRSDLKGKPREANLSPEQWIEEGHTPAVAGVAEVPCEIVRRAVGDGDERWWKLWEVSAACKDIGGMECYDGYHLALIDHTITLTLLPSLSTRRNTDSLLSHSPSYSSLPSLDAEPGSSISSSSSPSFLRRLAEAIAVECEGLLHWDLPISTIVEFNEVGKATHVRDIVDVQDLVETFVPFAKRLGWITRRLTGMVSSTLGSFAVSMLAPPTQAQEMMTRRSRVALGMPEKKRRHWSSPSNELLAPPIGLGLDMKSSPSAPLISTGFISVDMEDKIDAFGLKPVMPERVLSDTNSLGLEGVDEAGPDCLGPVSD